jgi:VCBS repeat protein
MKTRNNSKKFTISLFILIFIVFFLSGCTSSDSSDGDTSGDTTDTSTTTIPEYSSPCSIDGNSFDPLSTNLTFTYGQQDTVEILSTGSISGYVSGDLNGDGYDDLLYSGPVWPFAETPVPIVILQNTGDNRFIDGTSSIIEGSIPAPVHARDALIGDFNCDGKNDVLIAAHGYDGGDFPGEKNILLLSNENGKLVDTSENLNQNATFSHGMDAADINGDGFLDVFMTVIRTPGALEDSYVLLGDGRGGFSKHYEYAPVVEYPNIPIYAQLEDLDGDLFPDLILNTRHNNWESAETYIAWNKYSADFSESEKTVLPTFENYNEIAETETGDIDGDGDIDIILVSQYMDPFFRGQRLQIFINNGNRSFSNETNSRFPIPDSSSDAPNRVRLIDFDGDNDNDIIYEQGSWQYVQEMIFLNDGDGNYTAMDMDLLPIVGALFPMDIDNDSDYDLLIQTNMMWDGTQNWSTILQE